MLRQQRTSAREYGNLVLVCGRVLSCRFLHQNGFKWQSDQEFYMYRQEIWIKCEALGRYQSKKFRPTASLHQNSIQSLHAGAGQRSQELKSMAGQLAMGSLDVFILFPKKPQAD